MPPPRRWRRLAGRLLSVPAGSGHRWLPRFHSAAGSCRRGLGGGGFAGEHGPLLAEVAAGVAGEIARVAMVARCFPKPSKSFSGSSQRPWRSTTSRPLAPVLGTTAHDRERPSGPVAHRVVWPGPSGSPRPSLTQGRIDVRAGIVLCQPFQRLPPADGSAGPSSHTGSARDPAWPTWPGSLRADRAGWANVLLVGRSLRRPPVGCRELLGNP